MISPRIGPDWIRTSDIAVIDEDGFLFYRGRADGAIIRGGSSCSPTQSSVLWACTKLSRWPARRASPTSGSDKCPQSLVSSRRAWKSLQ